MEIILVVTGWGKRMLPASKGKRPEMLLNTLQFTGQPHNKNYLASEVNSEKTEKRCFKGIIISFVKSLNFLKTIG